MTRQYTERLISDALLYGDKHKHTMEMATWWLNDDKGAIHKLFKVLVPRYQVLYLLIINFNCVGKGKVTKL